MAVADADEWAGAGEIKTKIIMEDPKEILIQDENGNVVPFTYTIAIDDFNFVRNNEFFTARRWTFRIMPVEEQCNDHYEFTITRVDEWTGKVTQIHRNFIDYYSGKRIGDKMIEVASEVLGLNIISSSNNGEYTSFDPEWRTPPATRIWDRLVDRGIASYDSKTDIYRYPGIAILREYLIEIARTPHGSCSYSDVNLNGKLGLDLSLDPDRARIGALLGEIAKYEHRHGRPLLSAVVLHSDGTWHGDDFYRICEELELGSAIQLQRAEFGIVEMGNCHLFWVDEGNYERFRGVGSSTNIF